MASFASIAPDAIEVREIADISATLTANLATWVGNTVTAGQIATVLAGITIALAQARGLNYSIYNPAL
jgi:hypothetical protein